MIPWWQLPAAYGVDLLVGDPPWPPHPVVLIGRAITALERLLRGRQPGDAVAAGGKDDTAVGPAPASAQAVRERLLGVLLTILVVGGTYAVTWGLLCLAARVHPWLAAGLSVWLFSTTLAARGLGDAAQRVLRPLLAGDLPAARSALSWVVGRDTAHLDASEISRGALETVAENTSDGVVAPLLFGLVGGVPLAMAYKAINTLDSMVGYKNARYRYFGWASARLDDLANLIPARLTALLLAAAAGLMGQDGRHASRTALRVAWRDAHKHPSPNSGWPEAAAAGALGVRLGGLNYYGGRPSQRAVLHAEGRPCAPADIRRIFWLMHLSVFLLVAAATTVLLWLAVSRVPHVG